MYFYWQNNQYFISKKVMYFYWQNNQCFISKKVVYIYWQNIQYFMTKKVVCIYDQNIFYDLEGCTYLWSKTNVLLVKTLCAFIDKNKHFIRTKIVYIYWQK